MSDYDRTTDGGECIAKHR